MAGRHPKPLDLDSGKKPHRSNEEITNRENAEPKYAKQEFQIPPGLTKTEKEIWNEIVEIYKEMRNCPICDADAHLMQDYCVWRAILLNARKEKDLKTLEKATLMCDRLRKGLCLDMVSRAKAGSTQATNNDSDTNLFSRLLNRKKD